MTCGVETREREISKSDINPQKLAKNNNKTITHHMHALLGIPSEPGVSHFSNKPGVRILEHLLSRG